MSVRRDADTLMDIQESLRRIADCIVGISYEEFRQDTRRQDAVIRNLKIPGEEKSLGFVSEALLGYSMEANGFNAGLGYSL